MTLNKKIFIQKDPEKKVCIGKFEDEDSPHYNKKNTKKWCKGKPGVSHIGKWERRAGYFSLIVYEYRCVHCRKILDYWYNSEWMKDNPMPESLKKFLKEKPEEDK